MMKSPPIRSKKITQSARGEACVNCGINNNTIVFAHANCVDKGMGIKSPDWWGAYLCYNCHNQLGDGAVWHNTTTAPFWLKCIYLTYKILFEKGILKI